MVLRILLILLLCSCSGKYHLKQAKRHILKAEMLGEKWEADTVYKQIEVPIESAKWDTLTVIKPGDTIEIEKERLRVEIRRLKGDTIFVEAECLPDTVRIEVPIAVNKDIEIQRGIPWWWILVGIGAGFLLALIIRLLR